MTEDTRPEGQSAPVEGQTTADGTQVPERASDGSEGQGEPDMFPREYVHQLREEAKHHRQKAARTTALQARLVQALAAQTGRLADPTDLPMTNQLLDDEGYPDPQKISAAIDQLIKDKPHLAGVRPAGDVGQGVRGDGGDVPGLAALLRGAAV